MLIRIDKDYLLSWYDYARNQHLNGYVIWVSLIDPRVFTITTPIKIISIHKTITKSLKLSTQSSVVWSNNCKLTMSSGGRQRSRKTERSSYHQQNWEPLLDSGCETSFLILIFQNSNKIYRILKLYRNVYDKVLWV